MAEEGTENEAADGEEEGQTKGKKKLLLIIIALVVLLGGGAAGAYFGGLLGGGADGEEAAESEESAEQAEGLEGELANMPIYFELPEFLVNLSTTGKKVSFLKMQVTLELRDQAAIPVIDANKPRIVDVFNTYLRELRTADLSGSAGIYRLREELMMRVNKTVEPGIVKDILFSEIIVQ